MTTHEMFTEIKNILIVHLPEGTTREITESTELFDELGINSARLVDIVLDLEDKFGISISDSDMNKITTIRNTIQIVTSAIAGVEEPVEVTGAPVL